MAEIENTKDGNEVESAGGALTVVKIIAVLLVVAVLTILVLTLIGPSVSTGIYSNVMIDL